MKEKRVKTAFSRGGYQWGRRQRERVNEGEYGGCIVC
jgi:hypothetical protein